MLSVTSPPPHPHRPRAAHPLTLICVGSGYEEGRLSPGDRREKPFRKRLYAFLEARTPGGRRFESFIMLVIIVTVTQVGKSLLWYVDDDDDSDRGDDDDDDIIVMMIMIMMMVMMMVVRFFCCCTAVVFLRVGIVFPFSFPVCCFLFYRYVNHNIIVIIVMT